MSHESLTLCCDESAPWIDCWLLTLWIGFRIIIALHYTVLFFTSLHYYKLHCISVHCTAVHFMTLQCRVFYWNKLKFCTTLLICGELHQCRNCCYLICCSCQTYTVFYQFGLCCTKFRFMMPLILSSVASLNKSRWTPWVRTLDRYCFNVWTNHAMFQSFGIWDVLKV